MAGRKWPAIAGNAETKKISVAESVAGMRGRPSVSTLQVDIKLMGRLLIANVVLVHLYSPPFLSLYSSGATAKKFPGVLGVYKLDHTNMESHLVVGYSLLHDRDQDDDQEDFYLFRDYSDKTAFVSKVLFSKDENDLILYNNFKGWFFSVKRSSGHVELLEDPTVTLVPMETREEDGE